MQRQQLGFSLIEVMIALVVLSLGVLGMAALQTTAIQQNQSAYMRSQANQYAYDIIDRMRVNSGALNSYMDQSSGTEDSDCVSYSGTAAGCTTVEMAGNDLFEWFALLQQDLPGGTGRICRGTVAFAPITLVPDCVDVANSPVIVYIWWDDDRDGGTVTLSVSSEL
ncbi:type IV pilus modification protein PilV [Aliamphritea ceti]|uniref:type IV pilus modification protein PilV n=1 Tax=Aliamphritea ceti TaxID=1524258 RepID=UPI0021C32FFF|nr:type IV pilus modification protein PilV [Aliamphritea ceti]